MREGNEMEKNSEVCRVGEQGSGAPVLVKAAVEPLALSTGTRTLAQFCRVQ